MFLFQRLNSLLQPFRSIQNFTVCSFYACGGVNINVNPNYGTGSIYAQLYDSAGYRVASGSYIYYTVTGKCQTFALHQGCYEYFFSGD